MSDKSKPDSHSDAQKCNRDFSARETINEAIRLHSKWGRVFGQDERIVSLLREMAESAAASARVMGQVGVSEICMRCDTEEGGSCCGAGIETRYSRVLLLANLLMGIRLPTKRLYGDSCYFLGVRGCTLMARHVLCVNYLCSRIRRALSPEELWGLQQTTGREMELLFTLNEALKKKMAD